MRRTVVDDGTQIDGVLKSLAGSRRVTLVSKSRRHASRGGPGRQSVHRRGTPLTIDGSRGREREPACLDGARSRRRSGHRNCEAETPRLSVRPTKQPLSAIWNGCYGARNAVSPGIPAIAVVEKPPGDNISNGQKDGRSGGKSGRSWTLRDSSDLLPATSRQRGRTKTDAIPGDHTKDECRSFGLNWQGREGGAR
jgi:hypothetical protein